MGRVRSSSAHRAGAFKQTNKTHKTGRHRSKGQLAVEKKGRVAKAAQPKKGLKTMSKAARRMSSRQRREAKEEAAGAEKRSLGTGAAPPFLTAVLSLTEDVVPELVLHQLTAAPEEDVRVTQAGRGVTHVAVGRFKQRFSFVVPHEGSVWAQLDALAVADSAVVVWPADGVLSEEAQRRLALLNAAGLPALLSLVRGQKALRKPDLARKALKETLEQWSLEAKTFSVDSPADALAVLRQLGGLRRKASVQRARRSQLLAERTEALAEENKLLVYGYVRGPPLDANALVHLAGWGDFQLSQIDLVTDPHPLKERREGETKVEEAKVLQVADPKVQESLASEVVPDPMDGEQTWPTEEELQEAKKEARQKRKVPVGTSEYQAAWILEDEEAGEGEDDGEEEESDSEDGSGMEEAESEEGSGSEAEEEAMEAASVAASSAVLGDEKYDAGLDLDEERRLKERFRAQREDEEFPDEVDTPAGVAARERFQRYRGLASFRSSPWDPKENLPLDYARIFQFANFKATKKRVLKEESEGAMHGWFVRLHVKDVPEGLLSYAKDKPHAPLLVTRLLPFEQKMSMMNVVIRRSPTYKGPPVKSKDPMVVVVGQRRMLVRPLLSSHTSGGKQKMERWLGTESAVVASFYAPIAFPPAPVLVFSADQETELLASGSLLDLNPNRIVLKRLVLSGHPFKINVRSAVVRHMFHDREDVLWFKPVELRTKYGKRGHIKEPLGTHGHMKCVFDRQLNSMDTVLLTLYKRVFPKWSYEQMTPLTQLPERSANGGQAQDDDDVMES